MTILVMPSPPERDELIDALFQCLPAKTHKEIAERMSKQLGRPFRSTSVGPLLARLRSQADRHRWTVPHARRGINSEKADRFVHVLVERGRDPMFDAENTDQVRLGLISSLEAASTSLQNEAVALDMASQYVASAVRQKLNSLNMRMVHLAAEIGALRAEIA